MVNLDEFYDEKCPLRQNRLLFDWLRDDEQRAAFYGALRDKSFPVLRFKSVMRTGGRADLWPTEDVYLVSSEADVQAALKHYSVTPYAALESGGRFMLGIDKGKKHDAQHAAAAKALRFTPAELRSTARLAVSRACVLPLKNYQFDLVTDIAQHAALHFVELLFGLPPEAHVILGEAMKASYARLSFQIVGRHFVSDPGLPPAHSARSDQVRSELEKFVVDASRGRDDASLIGTGVPTETVIGRLYAACGRHSDEPVFVALGLMAGTIGNVVAAVSIAVNHFLTGREGQRWLLERATLAARKQSPDELWSLIDEALTANPAAPFLARTARGPHVRYADKASVGPIPESAQVLLALGANSARAMRFGGDWNDEAFPHRCVGRYLAEPLVLETVRQVLRLPGLSRVVDPDSGRPFGLEKRWGAICTKFPLQFQRDRLLNQQRLHVVLPIKEPIAENAEKLRLLTIAGAHVVEEALSKSRHVHFAWFDFAENNTHLAMSTVYDGNFDAYVEFFALEVPLFDKQFEFLADAPPLPIREHPKEFVDTIRKYDRPPLGGYFFSAYPRVGVAEINPTTTEAP